MFLPPSRTSGSGPPSSPSADPASSPAPSGAPRRSFAKPSSRSVATASGQQSAAACRKCITPFLVYFHESQIKKFPNCVSRSVSLMIIHWNSLAHLNHENNFWWSLHNPDTSHYIPPRKVKHLGIGKWSFARAADILEAAEKMCCPDST